MKIFIASDHAGFGLKTHIKKMFPSVAFHDLGPMALDEEVDYTDKANALAQSVGECNGRGILICGTGLGMSIAANKHKGIRATSCTNAYMAKLSRQHNNSNVLCLGERVIGYGTAEDIVDAWIKENFEGGRHARRLDKMLF